MKTLTLFLTALALCMTNVALADDVVIPTTDENPFDLTKGVITSDDTHEHFTDNGVEWMMDGDKIVYTLQNQQDADFYLASIWFDTGNNNVTVDMNLKSSGGSVSSCPRAALTEARFVSPSYSSTGSKRRKLSFSASARTPVTSLVAALTSFDEPVK